MGLISEIVADDEGLESLGERSPDSSENETYLEGRLLFLNAIGGDDVEPTSRLDDAKLFQVGRPYPGRGCAGIDQQTDVHRIRFKEPPSPKGLPSFSTDPDLGGNGSAERAYRNVR